MCFFQDLQEAFDEALLRFQGDTEWVIQNVFPSSPKIREQFVAAQLMLSSRINSKSLLKNLSERWTAIQILFQKLWKVNTDEILITSKWISVLSFSLHVKPIWSIFIPRKYILLIYTVHAKTNKYVKILCK